MRRQARERRRETRQFHPRETQCRPRPGSARRARTIGVERREGLLALLDLLLCEHRHACGAKGASRGGAPRGPGSAGWGGQEGGARGSSPAGTRPVLGAFSSSRTPDDSRSFPPRGLPSPPRARSRERGVAGSCSERLSRRRPRQRVEQRALFAGARAGPHPAGPRPRLPRRSPSTGGMRPHDYPGRRSAGSDA